MPNTKEKLIALIEESTGVTHGGEYGDVTIQEEIDISDEEIERIADHLIANGVTVAYNLSPTEPMTNCQQWIPVSERLQDEHTTVLIYDWESVYPSIFFCKDCFWTVDIYESDPICGVTHWMPLPDPPKGD